MFRSGRVTASEIAPLGMERVQLTDNFGRVIREEWIEFGDPLPPWAVEERRRIRAEKKARAKEEKSADGPSRKRRKTSEDGDYEADRDEKKYGIFWLRINGDADNEAETRYRLDGRRDSPVTHRPNR